MGFEIWSLECGILKWKWKGGRYVWNFEMGMGKVCVGDRRLRLLDGTRADLLRLARFDRGAAPQKGGWRRAEA